MQTAPIVAFDNETHRFGTCNLIPPVVCMSWSCGETQGVISMGDGKDKVQQIAEWVMDEAHHKVGHNVSYDLGGIALEFPHLIPVIFDQLCRGLIHDTIIREKLLLLADQGDLENYREGDRVIRTDFSLAGMAKSYLGIDRSAEKAFADSWRTNYSHLEKTPVAQWPQDAISYSLSDSTDAEQIFWLQEQKRQAFFDKTGIDPLTTETFQVAVDFCLSLMASRGLRIDAQAAGKVEEMLKEELSEDKISLLIEHGIIEPAVPPLPYANGAKNKDGTPKMKAGKKEKKNSAALLAYIMQMKERFPEIQLKRTKKSAKFPEGNIKTGKEFYEAYWHLDPVIEQFRNRQKLQKLVTTYIPQMKDETGAFSEVIHTWYDVIKRTGRTSSKSSDKYPSANFQQMDPRVRNCYIPREGYGFCSIDYDGMELGTAAQRCINLFGFSKLGNLINSGIGPHEYLGAQIAYATDEGFKASFGNAVPSKDFIYEAFYAFKDHEDPELKKFYKHYRTFAKPTGLGFPGGLGPDTFIQYAKDTYGVVVDKATAKQLKQIWLETFPEFSQYFEWINKQCIDHRNSGRLYTDDDGRTRKKTTYAYSTTFGMHRAGADYCAAANGAALQGFSAEGAKLGVLDVVRNCFDPSQGSVLYGRMFPIAFIHDEQLSEVLLDDLTHEVCHEASRLMVNAMQAITPDVKAGASPVLMRRWDKRAEAVYDENGRLTFWEPPVESPK